MLDKHQTFVIVIEQDNQTRDDLIAFLSSEGCLINGFSNLPSALTFLKSSSFLPKIILADENFTLIDWLAFNDGLLKDRKLKDIPIQLFRKPLNMKDILTNIEETMASNL